MAPIPDTSRFSSHDTLLQRVGASGLNRLLCERAIEFIRNSQANTILSAAPYR